MSVHTRGSKHAGEGNQFMGMVKLPEGAIVELKLRIDRNMRSKVLLEAELVQKTNKYLHSSHRYGDFDDLVQASDFYEINGGDDSDS